MQDGQQSQQRLWFLSLILLALLTFSNSVLDFNKGFDIANSSASVADMSWLQQEAFAMQHPSDEEHELAGYPPGLLYVHQITNRVLGITDLAPPAQYRALNAILLVTSITNSLLVILLALLGAKLHSRLLGLLVATIWVLAPLINNRVTVILTEPWQALYYTAAAFWALLVLEKQSARFAILSIVAGLLSVIFKYTAFSSLGFGSGVVIWLMLKDKWRKWGIVLAIQSALIIACAFWLFLGYGASDLLDRPEPSAFVNSGASRISLAGVWQIFLAALRQIGLSHPIFGGIFLLGSGLYLLDKTPRQRYFWLLLAVVTLFYILFILTYVVYWAEVHRYTTSVSPLFVLLMALSIVAIGDWIVKYLKLKQQSIRMIIPILPLIIWLIPFVATSIPQMIQRAKPSADKYLVLWLREAVPEGTLILRDVSNFYLLFNELNPYTNAARPWVSDSVLNHSLEEWRSIHVYYADIDDAQAEHIRSSEEGAAYLDSLLVLKHFRAENEQNQWRGNPFTIYYLGQPDVLSGAVFGDQIMLYGYDFELENNQLSIRPYWQATQTPQRNYQAYVHITPHDSRDRLVQADGIPALASYPTMAWQDSNEIIIGTEFTLSLPEDLDADSYRILFGLYDLETGTRLLTQDEQDYTELTAP